MLPATIPISRSFPLSAPRKAIYRVRQNANGHWCVSSTDGMTGGTFFDRDSAIRFARRESLGVPVLVLQIEPERARDVATEPQRGTGS